MKRRLTEEERFVLTVELEQLLKRFLEINKMLINIENDLNAEEDNDVLETK